MRLPLVLFLAGLGCGAALAQSAEDKPTWHADWATAQRLGKQANKPIFAVLVCRH